MKKEAPGQLVLGIDLGTTGVKVIALDPRSGVVEASVGREYLTSTTPHGGHEQNPNDWWLAVATCCRRITEKVGSARVAGVGLSGHMHSLLLLDRSLKPVRPAMTWADRRVGNSTSHLAKNPRFREIAGNDVVDAFTAPKLAWISKNEPESIRRTRHLLLSKDYIGLMLTGELATDITDAMGTLLWDIGGAAWDEKLFLACGSTSAIAPPVLGSTIIRGVITFEAAMATGIPAGVSVVAGAGDVSSAVVGTGVTNSSTICLNAGTAAQAMGIVPTAESGNGFLFGNPLGVGYVAMASVYAAGASIRWAERTLFSSNPIEKIAEGSGPGSLGLSYLPYMFGMAVPHKNDSARAAFFGQTESHGPAQFASSVLEGVAFACADAIDAVVKIAGTPLRINVVGGVSKSRIWRTALASVLDPEVVLLPEGGSAFGAAVLGALGSGLSTSEEALSELATEPIEHPKSDLVDAYREARANFTRVRDLMGT